MHVDYRRDLYSNCLILSEDKQPDLASYQVRMLMANELKGFLRCKVHQMDGRLLFYYDITSRQSLETIFEHQKISARSLEKILGSLVDGLDTVKNFLLNMDGFLLNPKFIYMTSDQKQVWFCYLPGNTEPFMQQIRNFSEFLLPKLDNQERRGVIMGYAFYQLTVRDSITAEEIQALLHSPAEQAESSRETEYGAESFEVTPEESEEWERERAPGTREELLESFFAEDEGDGSEWNGKQAAVFGCIAVAVGTVMGISVWMGRIPEGITAASALTAATALIYRRYFRTRDERSKEIGGDTGDKTRNFLEQTEQAENEYAEEIQEEEGTVCLAGINGRQKGRLIPLSPGGMEPLRLEKEILTVGKSRQNADVVLDSQAVSRVHARMIWDGETYRLSDLNSRNGTWVNHVLMEPERTEILKDGDEIQFADLTYLYRK